MYSTRLFPIAAPAAAGVLAFGNWAVAVVSIAGLLLLLLAVRSIRLRERPGKGAVRERIPGGG